MAPEREMKIYEVHYCHQTNDRLDDSSRSSSTMATTSSRFQPLVMRGSTLEVVKGGCSFEPRCTYTSWPRAHAWRETTVDNPPHKEVLRKAIIAALAMIVLSRSKKSSLSVVIAASLCESDVVMGRRRALARSLDVASHQQEHLVADREASVATWDHDLAVAHNCDDRCPARRPMSAMLRGRGR